MDMLKRIAGLVIVISLLAAGFAVAQTTEVKGDGYTVRIVGTKVVFTLTRAGVTTASVPGKFNDWKPEAPEAQMKKVGDAFVLEVDAAAVAASGIAEFKFFTDGKWDPDPNLRVIVEKQDAGYVFVDKVSRPATAGSSGGIDIKTLNLAAIDSLPESALFAGDGYKVAILDGKILVFVLEKDGDAASIPGAFNGWKPEAPETQMTKKDGKFYFAVDAETFAASKPMEYKFFLDGKWDPDPNKSLNLRKKDGSWVFAVSPTDKIKPNSNVSGEIKFSGRYTAWVPMQMNVSNEQWNKDGDDGVYLSDVTHNFDLDMHYKLGSMVMGFTRLKVNYRASGNRRMNLDMMNGTFMHDDFLMTAFYKTRESAIHFDNPSRSLEKYIDTYNNGIGFYGEAPGALQRFGRNYAGMYISLDSVFNSQLMLARRADRENDLIAFRAKPLKAKEFGVGFTYIYNANRALWPATYVARHTGGLYVNPWRYLIEEGYYNHEIGLDGYLELGSGSVVYLEGKMVRVTGTASMAASVDSSSAANIFATAGFKMKTGSLLIDLSGNFLSLGSVGTNSPENTSLIFGNAKARLDFSGDYKGYGAASFTVMLPSSTSMLFEQRLEGKLESELFDVWVSESFKSVKSSQVESYTLIDMRAGLDWYFSRNLIGVIGLRLFIDGNEGSGASTDTRTSYSTILPLAGLRYLFSDTVRVELFYGRELDYDEYLEDNGRTLQSYTGWVATGSAQNAENQLAKMHRITLKADVVF